MTRRRLALALLAAACLSALTSAQAETLIQRDAQGRRTGSAEITRDGPIVLRDERGRLKGKIERRGDTLIRRDAQGRRGGSTERRGGPRAD